MNSRVTMLAPDLNTLIGRDPNAVQQLMNIAAVFDQDGVLPSPPFTRVTPNVRGHGELWYHETGLFVIRTEHRPVLLASERCATCTLAHLDVCHLYLMMSPRDFEERAYMRYVSAPIELGQPGSESGGT